MKKNYDIILLILLICFHLISNILLLKENPLPEGKDSFAHAITFINFLQITRTGADHLFYMPERGFFYNLIFITSDYPGLFYFTAYLLNIFLSMIYVNPAVFTASLFFVILIVSIYKIGVRINQNTGILAAFVCSFYPIIHQFSRHFNLELATVAMVALAIWMLCDTDFFTNWFFSVLLGITLGLGMLTKQTFIVFISAPCLFYAAKSLSGSVLDKSSNRLKIKNILIAISIGMGFSAIFYWNRLIYESVINRAGFIGAVDNKDILGLKHLLYYPVSLTKTMGVFFVVAFLMGFINLRRTKNVYLCLFIIWFLFPMAFLSFFTLKYAEYTASVFPAAALITAAGIFSLRKKLIRNFLIILISIISFVFYFQIIYGFNRSFYSSCDIDKQYRFAVLEMTDTVGDDNLLVEDVIKKIGNSNISVGICYDDQNLFFQTYFIKRIFGLTRLNAAIVEFSYNTTAFFKNIDDFDLLIYITRSKRKWLTKNSFEEFIKDCNQVRNTKIVFSDRFSSDYVYANRIQISIASNLEEKLISLNKGYDQYCYLSFFNEPAETYEHVYLYRRRD